MDQDTTSQGFNGYRSYDGNPWTLTITNVNTAKKSVSGSFTFQGRMSHPAPADNFMTVTGTVHLRYEAVPPLP